MSDVRRKLPPTQGLQKSVAGRLLIGLALLVVAYGSFMPASQAYWDWRVRSMCAAEGGVKVFAAEKIQIDPKFVRNGVIRPPIRIDDGTKNKAAWEYRDGDPYFVRTYRETIRLGKPAVWKSTSEVVRAADSFVLGRGVMFGRSGGDLIAIDSDSQFLCPDGGVETSVINAVFSE